MHSPAQKPGWLFLILNVDELLHKILIENLDIGQVHNAISQYDVMGDALIYMASYIWE